eukprot:COSAG06_NODE_1137_length_10570_cov_6.358227_3_plen_61_part_00
MQEFAQPYIDRVTASKAWLDAQVRRKRIPLLLFAMPFYSYLYEKCHRESTHFTKTSSGQT